MDSVHHRPYVQKVIMHHLKYLYSVSTNRKKFVLL